MADGMPDPSSASGPEATGAQAPAPLPAVPTTAGGRLRQAREAQGLHIAALAASLKVTPRKLESLERDRYDELPDATFTRALAQTVCRALKIEAAPILALLPKVDSAALDQVDAGLNAPFRERNAGSDLPLAGLLRHPAFAVVVLLLVGALVFWFWPQSVPALPGAAPAASAPAVDGAASGPDAAASASVGSPGEGASGAVPGTMPGTAPASQPGAASSPVAGLNGLMPGVAMVETVHSAPAPGTSLAPAVGGTLGTPGSVPTPGPSTPGILTVRTREASWVEVVDGANRPLLSRTVVPGESVAVDGALPLRLTVGNAAATSLSFRGRPVDLSQVARENVARLELQ
jgi:cytoskeleton protein RodZ